MASEDSYRCTACGGATGRAGSVHVCAQCGAEYPVRRGIVDFLTPIPPDVEIELRGLAAEQGLPPDDLDAVKFLVVDHVATWDEQVESTPDDPMLYYRQTMDTFLEAFGTVALKAGDRVLEIGAEKRFPLLQRCAAAGGECFAVNIFYELGRDEPDQEWPRRVLSDMHDLPFEDGWFSLVVVSAAAHHSPNLPGLLAELSRVLQPGGKVLLLNELVAGYLKALGSRRTHDRSELIHEERIPYLRYRRAIRSAGFDYDGFFPQHFVSKLTAEGGVHPQTRFAPVAKALSWVWGRQPAVARSFSELAMPAAQAVLGFPMNAVLTKPLTGRSRSEAVR